MAQYARPTSDTSVGDWGPPPLFEKVGGSTPDDGTIIHADGDAPCVIALSTIAAPEAGTVTLRLRARRDPANPEAGLIVELLSGGASVLTRPIDTLTTTLALIQITLTTAERNAITDWAALAVRLTATALPANTIHYDSEPVQYESQPVTYEVSP